MFLAEKELQIFPNFLIDCFNEKQSRNRKIFDMTISAMAAVAIPWPHFSMGALSDNIW